MTTEFQIMTTDYQIIDIELVEMTRECRIIEINFKRIKNKSNKIRDECERIVHEMK